MPTTLYEFRLYKFHIDFSHTNGVVYEHPIARSGHRIIIDGYNLYSFGGYNPMAVEDYDDPLWVKNNPQFSEVWKYNLISHSWTRLDSSCQHPGMASACLIKYSRLAVLFGGTIKEFHECANNKLSVFHLDRELWSEDIETTGPKPNKLYGQGIINDGNKIYIVGGTEGHVYSLDVHVLDLVEQKWSMLYTTNFGFEIQPRYRHEIVKDGKYIYVIGGGTSDDAFSLSEIPTFNIESLDWSLTFTEPDPNINAYPRKRKCHVALKYKNFVYVHGGMALTRSQSTNETRQKPCNDFWRLNLDTLIWNKLRFYSRQSVFFHSGAITDEGCLYIFGGATPKGRTNQIERIWLNIPSLKTMSMEAVNHYYPYLNRQHSSVLVNAGIPRSFIKELKSS